VTDSIDVILYLEGLSSLPESANVSRKEVQFPIVLYRDMDRKSIPLGPFKNFFSPVSLE
jgi:hypothetical protein